MPNENDMLTKIGVFKINMFRIRYCILHYSSLRKKKTYIKKQHFNTH